MQRIYSLSGLVLLGSLFCAGCNGNDSCCSSTSKSVAKQRAVATMRITRATLVVAGFGRRITRGASVHMGNRVGLWLSAMRPGRAAPAVPPVPAQDADTGLYYTLTVNPDGSGQQNLFLDSAQQHPAGAFTWTAPQWTNDQPNTYPASFQTVYQITSGRFAGEHGTMLITADDVTGDNGTMTLDLTDAEKEHCISDFTITNGALKAKSHCTFQDNSVCDQVFSLLTDAIVCDTTYTDGGTENISVNSDGTATQTVDSPTGQQEATGTVQANGDDTIHYDDGTSETVNVDPSPDPPATTSSVSSGRKAAQRMQPLSRPALQQRR